MLILRILSLTFSLFALPALALPGEDYRFRVFLDDSEIGSHDFAFEARPEGYRVESRANYSVRLLFIEVYSYRHSATEIWSGECLASIEATTDDNGDDFRVDGEQSARGLEITVNGAPRQVDRTCVRTFAYWNPDLLAATHLLNSQTGELSPVAFESLGDSPLPWDESRRAATYRLATDEGNIHLWYDAGRRWLGLMTELDNDRVLTYRPATNAEDEGAGQ